MRDARAADLRPKLAPHAPSRTLVVLAFLAVYVLWGSTYLAIRVAVGTLPPFGMAATRFLVAGAILAAWTVVRGEFERPSVVHWRSAAIVGALLLFGGDRKSTRLNSSH